MIFGNVKSMLQLMLNISGDDGAIHRPDRRATSEDLRPGDDGAIHRPDRRAAIKGLRLRFFWGFDQSCSLNR